MKKKVILIGLATIGLGYIYLVNKPKVETVKKDNLKKTATIIIGNKTVDYVFNKQMTMSVGKVSLLYFAEIHPIENGFQVNILKGNKIAFQDNFYFE